MGHCPAAEGRESEGEMQSAASCARRRRPTNGRNGNKPRADLTDLSEALS